MRETSPGVDVTSPARSRPPIDRPNANAPRPSPRSVSSRAMISIGQREALAARQLAPNAYEATESGVIRAPAERARAGTGGGGRMERRAHGGRWPRARA